MNHHLLTTPHWRRGDVDSTLFTYHPVRLPYAHQFSRWHYLSKFQHIFDIQELGGSLLSTRQVKFRTFGTTDSGDSQVNQKNVGGKYVWLGTARCVIYRAHGLCSTLDGHCTAENDSIGEWIELIIQNRWDEMQWWGPHVLRTRGGMPLGQYFQCSLGDVVYITKVCDLSLQQTSSFCKFFISYD